MTSPRPILLIAALALALLPLRAQTLRTDINVDSLLAEAVRHIGTPYRYGGKGPGSFDCAGFTRYVYSRFGLQLPSSSAAQYPVGAKVEKGGWQAGDLVFFGGRLRHYTIGHVGLVTEADSQGFRFIHASNTGVRISASTEDYYARRYLGACRLIAASPAPRPGDTAAAASTPSPAAPAQEREDDTVYTLALVGDIMLGTTYPTLQLPRDGGRHLLDSPRPVLAGADLALGNLEGVFCDTTLACRKKEGAYSYAFRMPPEYASLLQAAGFDLMSLANNHSNDFGGEGQRRTMAALDSLGIRYAGLKASCQTALLRQGNITFGFAAFGHNRHTPSLLDSAAVRRILEPLHYACDILIVSFHGGAEGVEHTHLPDSAETYLGERRGHLRRFAHLCIDLGADVVFGHGPHVPRAMEVYKGRLVAYSLGNFCTPVGVSLAGAAAYAPLVEVRIGRSGTLLGGKIHSFLQTYRKGLRPDPAHKAALAMRKLTMEDFENPNITIDEEGVFQPTAAAEAEEE
ncbi:MAG: CapA family protein [Bacteroidales bacterium]|nr:CapA family protein [Bacteroidales bacterium]